MKWEDTGQTARFVTKTLTVCSRLVVLTFLGTETVVAVIGDANLRRVYFHLGASGCIWCSVPTQIQIGKAKSFRLIAILLGLKCV